MFHKVYLTVIALLLATLAAMGTIMWVNHKVASVKDNVVQEAALEANTRAAEVHAKETARVHQNKEKAVEQVRAANERHPEWADEPVPDDVAGILRDPAGSARQSD